MKNLSHPALAAGGEAGWSERLLSAQRRKLFEAFTQFRQGGADDTVLEVRHADAAWMRNWTESPPKSLVAACAIDPALPALRLPYPDNAFDWVFCPEVIEHAGAPERQQRLVAECYRVARKGVFLTTPNRRHPLEFNTGLPFAHWLPDTLYRRCLERFPRRQGPLALLDSARLYRLAEALPGAPAHDVGHKRVFGIKAHFFLMVSKPGR
ncbi:MAG TPA: methyltransferase domain-containing protein [Noviherbaspirillum sp.]|nr:methyltransferase domain-containing protein [Noviherbaspirillum sp.]